MSSSKPECVHTAAHPGMTCWQFDAQTTTRSWMTTPPTEPGWYWHQALEHDGRPVRGVTPRMVLVSIEQATSSHGSVLGEANVVVAHANSIRSWDAWSGPIQAPPVEATT